MQRHHSCKHMHSSSGSSSTHRRKVGVPLCHAFSQPDRPAAQLSRPSSRPQQPQPLQQQQQQQPLVHPPSSSTRNNTNNSTNNSLQQGPLRPGQLLSPPSRIVLSPREELRAARKLDDSDTRMAAYDALVVQVTSSGDGSSSSSSQEEQQPPSFNRGRCRVRPFMSAAMKAAHIQRPTPVQGALMAAIRDGSDVLSAAPPGCGSSTGALLGVVTEMLSVQRSVPRNNKAWPLGLLLCPTRELALQLAAQAAQLVAGSQLTVKCVTGGTPLAQQALDVRRGADLLVATPGRLMDLLAAKHVNLMRLKYMVLEEVDELCGPAMLPVTKQLLHHATMPPYTQRQTIALGSSALQQQQLLAAAADVLQPSAVQIRATWPLPQQQQHQQPLPQQQQQQQQLGGGGGLFPPSPATPFAALLADPATALAAAATATAAAIAPSITHRVMGVAPQLKHRTLLRLLSSADGAGGPAGPTLLHTTSIAAADEVAAQLEAAGVTASVLHYARSQSQREEALQCFRFGVTQVLVACGLAYRGLDLPDVSLVVNYEVPLSLAEYARRLGVAGRQGRPGAAVTLVTPADGALAAPLAALLTAGGQPVPDWLAALAGGGGSSTSSSGSNDDAGGDAEAPAAAAPAELSNSNQHQQKPLQEGSSSVLFQVAQPNRVQLGGYQQRRKSSNKAVRRDSSSSSSAADT